MTASFPRISESSIMIMPVTRQVPNVVRVTAFPKVIVAGDIFRDCLEINFLVVPPDFSKRP